MIGIKFKKKTIIIDSDDTKIKLNNFYDEPIVIELYDGREVYIDSTGNLEFYDKNGDSVDKW